jgi:hypothetical protein
MDRPLIFLDFDDLIVLNRLGEFGGYDVLAPNPPPEMWSQLFHAPAMALLVEVMAAHNAQLVLTTSWARFLPREAFEQLFAKAGYDLLRTSLHVAWEAPQSTGESRASAVDHWLAAHHRDEPYVVLDDELSGTGLRVSVHEQRGRVVLCKVGVGLQQEHLAAIHSALALTPQQAGLEGGLYDHPDEYYAETYRRDGAIRAGKTAPVDLEALSRESGIAVEVLRTFAGISDPAEKHMFTVEYVQKLLPKRP